MDGGVVRRSRAVQGIATLHQVAGAAGVSTATAARALGGYGSVSVATRAKVLETAERLGYRANGLARSMITGTTKTLGVVLSDIENPFFSRALRGVSDVAHAEGFEVVLVNTDEDPQIERNALRVLTERRVDGLVVSPSEGADMSHLAGVIASGTPVVLLDRRIPGLRADTVGIDNRAAARDVTERLLALGHRRIALLTGAPPVAAGLLAGPGLRGAEKAVGSTAGLRAAGYRDALAAAGIAPDPQYVSAEGFRREDAARATERLLALPEPPTAIIALDSLLSLGVLQAMADLDVDCPGEVSLIGFDDADWAEAVSPPLTVVAQPVYDIGAEACRRLLARIAGNERRPVHRKLPTTFVDRASTGPAPQ
jgi:LacI family transcriptional regulator, galactose operon repressor